MSVDRWQRAACALLFWGLTSCHKHVVIRGTVVETATAQKVQWLCEPGKPACEAGGTVDDSLWNQSHTARIPLAQCPHGIAQILVRNANKKSPQVHIVCKDAVDDVCPDGQPQVPDVVSGGLKCP